MSLNVSVVIPTYNGARFIREAIESVFAQTVLPAEIIVVDDCSTDETLNVVESMRKESPVPLHVHQLPKNSGGPPTPLNTGIALASSPLIALLEQDDRMAERRLELQAQALVDNPNAALCSGLVRTFTGCDWSTVTGDYVNDLPQSFRQLIELSDDGAAILDQQSALQILCEGNFCLSNSNLMFRKSDCAVAGGFSLRWIRCSDLAFELAMITRGPLVIVNSVVCHYLHRPTSLYRQDLTKSQLEVALLLLEFVTHFPELAGDADQTVYWDLRRLAANALKQGRLISAFRLYKKLGTSGLLYRHIVHWRPKARRLRSTTTDSQAE